MKKCPSCGAVYQGEPCYCSGCGHPLIDVSDQAVLKGSASGNDAVSQTGQAAGRGLSRFLSLAPVRLFILIFFAFSLAALGISIGLRFRTPSFADNPDVIRIMALEKASFEPIVLYDTNGLTLEINTLMYNQYVRDPVLHISNQSAQNIEIRIDGLRVGDYILGPDYPIKQVVNAGKSYDLNYEVPCEQIVLASSSSNSTLRMIGALTLTDSGEELISLSDIGFVVPGFMKGLDKRIWEEHPLFSNELIDISLLSVYEYNLSEFRAAFLLRNKSDEPLWVKSSNVKLNGVLSDFPGSWVQLQPNSTAIRDLYSYGPCSKLKDQNELSFQLDIASRNMLNQFSSEGPVLIRFDRHYRLGSVDAAFQAVGSEAAPASTS